MTTRFLIAAGLFLVPAATLAAPTVAIFPFELIDSSQDDPMMSMNATASDEDTRRLQSITAELRDLVKKDGRYNVIDLSPLSAEIAEKAPLHKCNDCEIDLAKKANAEFAMLGAVQKISSVLLNLNLFVRDVATGKTKHVMTANMQGNTDESWMRTLRWIVKNRLFAEEKAAR